MEHESIIEPEASARTREEWAINGLKYALAAATGLSLVLAAELAREQFRMAKKKAELMNQSKE